VAAALDEALGAAATDFTCAYAVAVGELVVACAADLASTVSTISDTPGNTYSDACSAAGSASVPGPVIAAAILTAALTTSSTISASRTEAGVAGASFTGCLNAPYATAALADSTSTTTPTLTTSASVNAGDLVVGFAAAVGSFASRTWSTPSGWTALSTYGGSSSTMAIAMFYLIAPSTQTYTLNPTASSSEKQGLGIAAFPAISSLPAPAPTNYAAVFRGMYR
jgi:hypothetical protein